MMIAFQTFSHLTGGSACITIRPRVSGGVIIEGNILQNTLKRYFIFHYRIQCAILGMSPDSENIYTALVQRFTFLCSRSPIQKRGVPPVLSLILLLIAKFPTQLEWQKVDFHPSR